MSARRRALVLVVLILAALAASGCGGGSTPTALEISDVWARPTPAAAENGVVYLSIASPDDDRLLAASVPATVAGRAELHESMLSGSGGMPDMPGMDHGSDETTGDDVTSEPTTFAVGPHDGLELAPGGRHVMLIGLAAPLREGDHFPLTLDLETAGPQTVDVEVRTNAP